MSLFGISGELFLALAGMVALLTSVFINKENNQENLKAKHNYQKVEEYWRKRKKECEKNLSKFC